MPRPPLLPCGTLAAYQRHIRRREPACDACKAAVRAEARTRTHRGPSPRELQPCGTPAAARRHWRRGEPACPACRAASRTASHAAQLGTMAEDWRPIRNGLPLFRPYVYRGLGYDQYEHLYEEAS